MDILIAAGGMPFGPLTLDFKSLGGSETSAIQLAYRLAEQGQDVTVFSSEVSAGWSWALFRPTHHLPRTTF
jgi:hypothetical protein